MEREHFTLPAGITWAQDFARRLLAVADPVWLIDPERSRITWANPSALALWNAPDLVELAARPLDIDDELEGTLALLARGEVVTTRRTLAAPRTPMDVLRSPVRLSDGALGVLCRARAADGQTVPDVARGVEALQHTDVLVTMTTIDGHLLMENPAARRVYAFSSRTTPNVVAARFSAPEEARRAHAFVERGASFSREVEVETLLGRRWHALDIHVSTDPVTEAPCLIITERDISRRKDHEVALEHSRAELQQVVEARTKELALERDQFEQVFDTVSALVLVVGADGVIQRANAWAHSSLHTSDLVGRNVYDTCGFPSPEQLQGWIAAGRAPTDPAEVRLDNIGGRSLDILWTPHVSEHVSGRAERTFTLFLTGVDISEMRTMQGKLQVTDRMATIGTLAAGLAHDLNNPLAYVTSNAEMLLETLQACPGTEEALEMARDCLDGARRAATIVGQLRTFARGTASGAKGVAHVRSVLDFARRLADNHVKHHAKIAVDCPQDLYAIIDESKLGQAMLNLIVHAANSIDPGQASRHQVRISAEAQAEGWLEIVVEDDGPGLSPADLRRIFDPYSGSSTPPRGMSGLGLAISQRIVQEAGGHIEVSSEAGRGTQVQLRLRRVAQEATADLGPTPPRPISSPRAPLEADEAAPRPSVLVVDDEPRLRKVVRRALPHVRITEAGDGREALECMAQATFDVVLCDVMMPELTGIELYEMVSKSNPEQAQRFIFLSGGAFTEGAAEFLDEVARPVINKPFRMDAIRKIVAEALDPEAA